METLGQRLRRLREERGYTQEELAKRAKCAQSTLSGLERDTRPKRPDLLGIADALKVDVYYLRDGVTRLAAGDAKINEVATLMQSMSPEGKAIVLDKARDVSREYGRGTSGSARASGE